jgi:predicted glycosyltransferase
MHRLEHARILMYSHDTFGLGHLRRCRAIAHALVERFKGLFVLIISGSQIAGTFDFRARVDFVKIPSVIKLYNGQYTSIDELIDLQDTLAIRKAIIRNTAEAFDPDLFIVDKEPLGLQGEIEDTLAMLRRRGTTLVLGLRDVMDAPERLEREWAPQNVLEKIGQYYDDIWVYGTPGFWDPLTGLAGREPVRAKTTFSGFLRRHVPAAQHPVNIPFTNPYILVTAGGGGDGAALMSWVLAAYEEDKELPFPAVLVLGPFMPIEARERLRRRADALANVHVIDFDNRMEALMAGAVGVVAMGGYNTFCEILSFDKRSIIVPRTEPREEQLIRARRGSELGLTGLLHPDQACDSQAMAKALRELPNRPRPSGADVTGLLDGFDVIGERVEHHMALRLRPALTIVDMKR